MGHGPLRSIWVSYASLLGNARYITVKRTQNSTHDVSVTSRKNWQLSWYPIFKALKAHQSGYVIWDPWNQTHPSVLLYWFVCIVVVVLCGCYLMCICCTVCILLFFFFTLDAGLLVRSQYSEGPATDHLDTGFSWFPCVYKQILRWFPTFQVATTCFSCSPPDLYSVVTDWMFCIHVK